MNRPEMTDAELDDYLLRCALLRARLDARAARLAVERAQQGRFAPESLPAMLRKQAE
jgi:hypothetical protein